MWIAKERGRCPFDCCYCKKINQCCEKLLGNIYNDYYTDIRSDYNFVKARCLGYSEKRIEADIVEEVKWCINYDYYVFDQKFYDKVECIFKISDEYKAGDRR